MFLIFILLVGLLLLFSLKLYRNIYNPVSVLLIVWGILISLYNYIYYTRSGCQFLSDKLYVYICIYLLLFSFCNFFINGFYKNRIPKKILVKQSLTIDSRINMFVNFCLVANILLILGFIKMCGTANLIELIGRMRYITQYEENTIPYYVKLLMYCFSITPVVFCYIFIEHKKVNKIKLATLFLELGIVTLLYVSKGRIIKYMIMFLFLLLLRNKLNFRIIVLVFAGTVGLVCFLTFNRDTYFVNTFTVFDYIFVYFLSPFPAFDKLINGEIPYLNTPFGGRTLSFFYRVSAKLFGTVLPNYGKMFLNVDAPSGKVPTNVFTALGNHYMDYGFLGIIFFSILIGITFALIYRKTVLSDSLTAKIFYVLVIYCLIFQFFGELFFQFLSMTIQDFICVYIVVHRMRLKNG